MMYTVIDRVVPLKIPVVGVEAEAETKACYQQHWVSKSILQTLPNWTIIFSGKQALPKDFTTGLWYSFSGRTVDGHMGIWTTNQQATSWSYHNRRSGTTN
eukprot:13398529-Ditylum_brightwellii.AAC.1